VSDKVEAARKWLAKAIEEDGYVDETGMNDSDAYPDEGWRHLKELAVDRRCGNCRWAKDSRRSDWSDDADDISSDAEIYPKVFARYPLRCTRASSADDSDEGASPPNPSPMGAWSEGGFRGDLLVSPDFGCVQWAAKDTPSPEPK